MSTFDENERTKEGERYREREREGETREIDLRSMIDRKAEDYFSISRMGEENI